MILLDRDNKMLRIELWCLDYKIRLAQKSEPYFLPKLNFISDIEAGIQLTLYLDKVL